MSAALNRRGGMTAGKLAAGLLFAIILLNAAPAYAYVGPGAGFAFVGTFFIFFISFVLALFAILTWPLRWLLRTLIHKKRRGGKHSKRVVVLGIDGMDPELAEQYMAEGLLPNFARLKQTGSFRRLGTTVPAESPVAWSSFMTGCNPGKHRIFDFLVPNPRTMLPELSSASVTPPARNLNVGRWRIPLSRPRITSTRGAKTFWKTLSEYGIFSTIIRVPLTFPPEKFNGLLLSAMCVPDLKGSQGTFSYYTSNAEEKRDLTSGVQFPLELKDETASGVIAGPANSLLREGGEMKIPFRLVLTPGGTTDAILHVDGARHAMRMGEYTPWITVTFRPGLGMKVRGIARFLLLETTPHVRLYMTPLQIDPARPALPISHPFTYSMYLARTQSTFASLGLAEDTSALNEGVIDEQAFMKQCLSIHRERETMFFDALQKTPRGAVVCVFDLADRVQHMFLQYLDRDHPGRRGKNEKHDAVVKETYQECDALLGRVMEQLNDATVLMVVSDHGFKSFRRGVNLNAWLRENGYLAVKKDNVGGDMLQAVDWSGTRAYALGFGGIYLNRRGRESGGVVAPGKDADGLKREITEKLEALKDPADGTSAVREVFDGRAVYTGPYVDQAPDLIAGFRVGYRAAWSAVTGGVDGPVFEDNLRPWGGDHSMHPAEVPGVFFCNRAVDRDDLHIQDIAPTVLDLFGIPVPGNMDGHPMGMGVVGEGQVL